MTLRAGMLAGLIAAVVLVGGLWFLNSTRAGLAIKCSWLNDMGACFLYSLTEPIGPAAPAATEDPAAAAERERQEAERRREEARERALREADRAVESASSDLRWAVDSLVSLAERAATEAESVTSPTAELDAALDTLRHEYEELAAMIAAGSTGEFWVDEVSFALYDVEFARDAVDFAVDGVEFGTYGLDELRDTRSRLERDIDAAMSALRSAQRRHPEAAPPSFGIESAEADLERLNAGIDASLAVYGSTQEAVQTVLDQADAILSDATELAASVGAQ